MLPARRRTIASPLPDLLKKARERAGITQIDLAQRLKRSQAFVSKYEHGNRQLRLEEVAEVCDALGVSILDVVATWVALREEAR